jgi:hypothetical protein
LQKKDMRLLTAAGVLFIFCLPLAVSAQQGATANTNLLASYYNIKNALVEGNVSNGAAAAYDLQISAKAVKESLPAGTFDKIMKDAGKLAETKDIEKQRSVFSDLTASVYAVAGQQKLSNAPIYRQYCPMKKVYWLSDSPDIRNPYYGSRMLSCGKVVETIKP